MEKCESSKLVLNAREMKIPKIRDWFGLVNQQILLHALLTLQEKTIEDEFYNVTGEFYHCGSLGLPTFLSQPRKGWIKESRKLTAEQLANKLYYSSTNGLNISIHNISSFERIVEKYKYRPILISDKIYTEYIKQNSQNSKYWRQETREIKDITYPLAELI